MTARPSIASPILAALLLLLLPLGAYIAGYYWLTEGYFWFQSPGRTAIVDRHYRAHWEAQLFTPAARVEGVLRGCKVTLRYLGDCIYRGVL